LANYAEEHRISRSRAIEYMIRMGRVYLQVLDEQGRDPEFMRKQRLLVTGAKGSEEKVESVGDAENP